MISKTRNIIVSGATSMIAQALIKACIKADIGVYALVRKGRGKTNCLPVSPAVKIFECDLDFIHKFSLPSGVSYCALFHLAWAATDKDCRNDPTAQTKNIQYTIDAVHLAKRSGCKKFIGVGSQAEYGRVSVPLNDTVPVNPDIAYGVAKYAAGKLAAIECKKNDLEYNWVRILSVYGRNDNCDTLIKTFIDNCKNNKQMLLGPCTHVWDYLFEDDAGEALLAIAENGTSGKTYCLGSGNGRPLKEYLEEIKNIINPNYTIQYGGIPYTDESVQYLCADITDLKNDCIWQAKTSFTEGIKQMLQLDSLHIDSKIGNQKHENKFKALFYQFFKFGIVGISNTVISYVGYLVLVFFGVHYLAAHITAFVISVLNSFYWNNKYVFKRSEKQNAAKTLIKMFMSYGITLCLSTLIIFVSIDIWHISKYIAPSISLIITVPLNFALNKLWVFKTVSSFKTVTSKGVNR